MPATVETKVIDRGAERFKGQLKTLQGAFTDIGIFGGTKRGEGSPVSIAEYAFYNEMGVDDPKRNLTIPERSFIRSVIDANGKKYQAFLDDALTDIAFGLQTPQQVLKKLGIRIEGDIKKKIVEGPFKKNADSTIRAKARTIRGKEKKKVFVSGGGAPLRDTLTMLRAINHKVSI